MTMDCALVHHDHDSSLCKSLQVYLEENSFLDLTFVCKNNCKVQAHKMILCCVSPLLKSLLAEQNEEPAVVMIPEVEIKNLKSVLTLLYVGYVSMSGEDEMCSFGTVIDILGIQLPQTVLRQIPNFQDIVVPPSLSHVQPQGDGGLSPRSRFVNNSEIEFKIVEEPVNKPVTAKKRKHHSSQVFLNKSRVNSISHLASEKNKSADTPGEFKYCRPLDCSDSTPDTPYHHSPRHRQQLHSLSVQDRCSSLSCKGAPPIEHQITNDKTARNRKPFSSSSREKSQSERRPFVCDTCGLAFTIRSRLSRHLKTHSGIRPHACPQCERRFAEKCDLESHMLRHTGERPFVCSTCSATFRQRSALARHRRTHGGDRL